jgi:hypothetical protein
MSSRFHERSIVLLNEVAIVQAATSTGVWMTCPRAQAFNIWYYCTSAGAPSVTLNFDYSIFGLEALTQAPPGTYAYGTFHPASTARTNYRTISLASGVITLNAWTHIDTPAEMKYPFASCRIRAVEADAAAVTTLTVAMGIQGL